MKTARFSARHDPRDCPNKQVYVRAIEDDSVGSAGGEGSDRGDVGDCDQYTDFDEDDGENIRDTDTHLTLSVQVTDDLAQPRDTCDQQQRQGSFINVSQNLDISLRKGVLVSLNHYLPSTIYPFSFENKFTLQF